MFLLSACGRLNPNYIRIPEQSDIAYVDAIIFGQVTVITDLDWILKIAEQFDFFQPTRIEYRREAPSISSNEWINLSFRDENGDSVGGGGIVYQQKNKWYLFQAYNGVFLANDIFVELIMNIK